MLFVKFLGKFQVGTVMGTVRVLSGYCMGTVWGLLGAQFVCFWDSSLSNTFRRAQFISKT